MTSSSRARGEPTASVVRPARPGLGVGVAVTFVVGSARARDSRLTSLAAVSHVADEALGAGRLALSTRLDTPHPDISWTYRRRMNEAPLPSWAGSLLAVSPVDFRAPGDPPGEPDTLLALGTRPPFTGGKAGRTIRSLAAQKTLGAARGLIQLARATAPSLAEESARTSRLACGGHLLAGFTLLPYPYERTRTNQDAFIYCLHRAADETFRAVTIRQTSAVGAVARHRARVDEAPKRRLTILALPATALVGHQAPTLLVREHGGRPCLRRPARHSAIPCRVQQPDQGNRQEKAQQHGKSRTPLHGYSNRQAGGQFSNSQSSACFEKRSKA